MTRTINIDKMKLDAAKAILDTLDAEDYISTNAVSIEGIRKIDRGQLDGFSLEKLHAILGRLTP